MTATTPFDLDKLFEGSLRRLRVEAEYFSRLTDHNPELGRLNETHLVKLLRDYLPPKVGIGTGFIVCGGATPLQSPQCDIVLYDALNNTPLYRSDAWSIYPIEMVYGVIEVKTTLKGASLDEAFEKCAMIRAMTKTSDGKLNKAYMRQVPPIQKKPARYEVRLSKLPPRFSSLATMDGNSRERWRGTSKPSAKSAKMRISTVFATFTAAEASISAMRLFGKERIASRRLQKTAFAIF